MAVLPCARTDELVVKKLGDETLVYDLRRHRAHCLDRSAELIWRAADGRRTPEEIAREVGRALGAPVEIAAVEATLDELGRNHLLTAPRATDPTRRQVLRGLAYALPAILTVTAPTSAYAAQSCLNRGRTCTQGARPPCCPGLTCRCRIRRRQMRCRCR